MKGMDDRKEVLKGMIRRLHEGESPEEIKEEFKELLGTITPAEIAQIEQELVEEGMPREELQKLCDVHLAIFNESLEKEKSLAPPGHPLHTLMEEHKILLKFANELKDIAKKMVEADSPGSVSEEIEHLAHIVEHLKESESHYLREENVLFPFVEKHGITQPPAIMWMEHDKIRETKKSLYEIVESFESLALEKFSGELDGVAESLHETLSGHFYKENNILFPTALNVLKENEWVDVRKQFDEIGYCCFTPELPEMGVEKAKVQTSERIEEGMVTFETGSLSREEIESIFDSLPVDITFVDKDDTVRYFSQAKDRIFVRAKAVIGRKVQQCHPQKSIHVVNQILEDFKSGKRDVAEFWINYEGRLIHIRYFPVRNKEGDYLGCIEVTQDITEIKKIEGEKRLL